MSLNHRQRQFVSEYLVDLNATQAAIRAGYSPRTAYSIGFENLKKPEIQSAIEAERESLMHRIGITQERVLAEYAVIGFADIRNYLKFDDDGKVYLDWSEMPEEATKAIAELVQEEFVDGKGENARDVKRTRFKLHNKLGALDSIAKHLGMFVDKREISGPGGKPIQQEHGFEIEPAKLAEAYRILEESRNGSH